MYKSNITITERKNKDIIDVFIYISNNGETLSLQNYKIAVYYGKSTKPMETLQGQTVTSFSCDKDLQDEFIVSLVDRFGKVLFVDTFYLLTYLFRI